MQCPGGGEGGVPWGNDFLYNKSLPIGETLVFFFILIHGGHGYSSGFLKLIFTVNNISSAYHLAVSVLCVYEFASLACVKSLGLELCRCQACTQNHVYLSCHCQDFATLTERVRVPLSLYFSNLLIWIHTLWKKPFCFSLSPENSRIKDRNSRCRYQNNLPAAHTVFLNHPCQKSYGRKISARNNRYGRKIPAFWC
jgi:hypothetical protein